jgi:predicted ATP-dependent protease
LLSALSGKPINQHFAVTGSVNQMGEVQAIGGANEKLEGFFQLCKARGLNGKHGAVIPASNVKHLMLKQEVVDAIKDGKFHIYPVSTIDEGIEVLTAPRRQAREERQIPREQLTASFRTVSLVGREG